VIKRLLATKRGTDMEQLISQIENYAALVLENLPGFLFAGWLTIQITVLVILLSWVCGLLAALSKRSHWFLLRGPSEFYIWFVRGTPSLIQIFMVYFGLPQLGIRLSPFVAGVITLGVNSGAYVAEIIRGGFLAIPRGQYESPIALGMSGFQSMQRIILPQVVRVILPAITNEAIATLKNTSLLSLITVVELTFYTQIVIARTFEPFQFYIMAALIYLALTTVLSRLAVWLESRGTYQ
jgi:His/Glu/Gln/Arg/opine family amino acid ABC transporter permease subunit